jgi:hypothetical protein
MMLQRISTLLVALAITAAGQTLFKSVPRTTDGHPDLQGIWTNATLTSLQQPAELKGKEFFTEQEAAAYEKSILQAATNADRPEARKAGDPGTYNQAFFDRGSHIVKTRRTSLVVDPPDGRIPAYTPAAQARLNAYRAYSAQHGVDGPEDHDLSERCLMFSGIGRPMLSEPYNNNYQVVQSPGYVVILAEMNHEARIIPTEGQAPFPASVSQWHGNSRGHWEGDALVVETTKVRFNEQSHFGVAYRGMSDENLRVAERFTRTAPDTIMYRATVEDPTVYSGAKLWDFHSVPRPGELGNETWQGDSWKDRSGTNAWTFQMTMDEARGIVYMPFGAPSSTFYGGDRKGANLYGNSLASGYKCSRFI